VNLIHLENVSKIYQVGDQEIRALDQINLRIEVGEFVAIIGPSGSGKSTLMHLLGCLDTPSAGRMVICGNELSRATPDQLAQVRNQEIGFVFQAFNLLSKLDVVSNIELPLIYGGVPAAQRRERARKVACDVGLGDRLSNRPPQLSGGQCQRVAIARALVNNPQIIFADEPTGNLDSRTGEEIMALFEQLYDQGNTIIVVTHEEDIARHARRIVRLRDGLIERDERS
jgi:putative ABC transport system ATP-binding protein